MSGIRRRFTVELVGRDNPHRADTTEEGSDRETTPLHDETT